MCSSFDCYFVDNELLEHHSIDLSDFDMVVVHYSVRLPYNQLGQSARAALANHTGITVLFIQDEFDNTNAAKAVMKEVKFSIVFTVIPSHSIEIFYPKEEFPFTVFVNNLTGYVPDKLEKMFGPLVQTSDRDLVVA